MHIQENSAGSNSNIRFGSNNSNPLEKVNEQKNQKDEDSVSAASDFEQE